MLLSDCSSLLPHSGEQLWPGPLRLDGWLVVSRGEEGRVALVSRGEEGRAAPVLQSGSANLTDAERRVKHQWSVCEKTPSEQITIKYISAAFYRTKTIQWLHCFAVGCTFWKVLGIYTETSPFTRNTPKRGNIYTSMDALTIWPGKINGPCLLPEHNCTTRITC